MPNKHKKSKAYKVNFALNFEIEKRHYCPKPEMLMMFISNKFSHLHAAAFEGFSIVFQIAFQQILIYSVSYKDMKITHFSDT